MTVDVVLGYLDEGKKLLHEMKTFLDLISENKDMRSELETMGISYDTLLRIYLVADQAYINARGSLGNLDVEITGVIREVSNFVEVIK